MLEQTFDRFGYGGQTADNKQVAFVNLREIRGIRFGTKGPQIYHDLFYGVDLEIIAFGAFSLKIVDPVKFIREFVPVNTSSYSFDDKAARSQLLSEFLQSFTVALNTLSDKYRISQLPAKSNDIVAKMIENNSYVKNWKNRFGLVLIAVGVENIEFSAESKLLVNQYSTNKMNINAYADVSQKTANIAAQQKIAQGIQSNGLGDSAGMLFGMNMAQNMGTNAESKPTMSIDEQINTVTKLKQLLDAGILSQNEFDQKKKEIMGL
ncbi:SPFH domain-containing protein [Loigolactobacillus binensis]|uniref:SPFH domain-containing protein n=1 Tax=Loigolactobacillus binensis TaxID=2559922 RepID=A0ABW3ECM2_9LACO